MATETKKKTRRRKNVAAKEPTKEHSRQLAPNEAAAASAIATILPKNLTKFLNNSGMKPSEAYFLGVASSQFISGLTPLQRELVTNLLELQTDTPDTL